MALSVNVVSGSGEICPFCPSVSVCQRRCRRRRHRPHPRRPQVHHSLTPAPSSCLTLAPKVPPSSATRLDATQLAGIANTHIRYIQTRSATLPGSTLQAPIQGCHSSSFRSRTIIRQYHPTTIPTNVSLSVATRKTANLAKSPLRYYLVLLLPLDYCLTCVPTCYLLSPLASLPCF